MKDETLSSNKIARDEEKLSAINLSGKDPATWEKRKSRLYDRIINTVRHLLGQDEKISEETVAVDVQNALDSLADNASQRLKGPALVNAERQANIQLKLAQARELNANARLKEIEAAAKEKDITVEELQALIERKEVLASQELVNTLVSEGRLSVINTGDGELVIAYRPKS
jgi:uncharacterized protein YbjQ (UPF0145 family)